MATKLESDNPSSAQNDESEGEEEQDSLEHSPSEEDSIKQESVDEVKQIKPTNNNVENILKRLQATGALLKKPKQEYRCFTCEEDFSDFEVFEKHLLQHVTLPLLILDKLQSDDEDTPPSGDENWSDEEDDEPAPATIAKKTPQKIDVSQIMQKTGLSIKKSGAPSNNSDSALSKLSGLGFTIKKNSTPIKQEKIDSEPPKSSDVMEKLGKLGGIKLKLKSDGSNSNTFKVINGLKDFKTSDDESGSGNEDDSKDDQGEESDAEQNKHISGGEQESGDEQNTSKSGKDSDDEESEIPLANSKIVSAIKNRLTPKKEPKDKPLVARQLPAQVAQPARPGRPPVKQTPKRGAQVQPVAEENPPAPVTTQPMNISTTSTPERRESQDISMSNVVVKKEENIVTDSASSNIPLFSGQIKSERSSPPPMETISTPVIPVISQVKSEPDSGSVNTQPMFQNSASSSTSNLLPVTKTEGVTIIEINGDSGDDDDDCCVVSSTPAPDVKPVIPKIETIATNPPPAYPEPAFSSTQPSYSTPTLKTYGPSSRFPAPSTEKQHTFNWNAPDTKPPIDMLEKSADDIFESLLSSTKKESHSLSDVSEYISLDTLGPQHSCEVCNTRFTSISLLDDHRRMTGHSQSLVTPTSSTMMPYNPSSNILSSLLPVKQLAEQVGKLSTIGGPGAGFTHQQNVMINIQAYPGAGGMVPQQQYNSYPPGQGMHPGFPQSPNNMYGATAQPMPGQYPGQHYMGQQPSYGQQYQPPMSKSSYPGTMPNSSYSTSSPLQGMQQAVFGQSSGLMNSQVGQMGPPGSSYVPTSSPSGMMKPPSSSNIRIQNVQTFPPGQMTGGSSQSMGSETGGQMPAPGPIRMAAGANIIGSRPQMPSIRGPRPSIRQGIQVQGKLRGPKPAVRMPMKRGGGMVGGPQQKRRTDMLLPGKHDNEDCTVMAMQKQREGLPLIHSVQGAKDKLNLGSQISITKKTVNKEASAMANVLASRGISIKQKQKSRSPSPERPIPHIPNLGAGVSIKHTSKSSNFSIPEAQVGGGMMACKVCKKMFMNFNSLSVHMSAAHPTTKIPMFKCDECPASYPKTLQLQHHKRVFHNVSGPNRELGLPVVDLSQEDNLKRLSNLGIYSFIPLANREQTNGCFGIPVISVHNMHNGMTSALQALGADGLLSLGPLKPLPNS